MKIDHVINIKNHPCTSWIEITDGGAHYYCELRVDTVRDCDQDGVPLPHRTEPNLTRISLEN